MPGAHRRRIATRGCFAALAGGHARPPAIVLAVALAAGVLAAGCTGPSQPSNIFGGLLGPPPMQATESHQAPSARAHAAPTSRGSCSSAAECKVVLKTMIENPDRGWIGQPQPPDAYANGTRLFAYRALRKQLTCNELTMAVDELQSVSQSLGGGGDAGMAPEQMTRTRTLSSQVQGELVRERDGRCRT